VIQTTLKLGPCHRVEQAGYLEVELQRSLITSTIFRSLHAHISWFRKASNSCFLNSLSSLCGQLQTIVTGVAMWRVFCEYQRACRLTIQASGCLRLYQTNSVLFPRLPKVIAITSCRKIDFSFAMLQQSRKGPSGKHLTCTPGDCFASAPNAERAQSPTPKTVALYLHQMFRRCFIVLLIVLALIQLVAANELEDRAGSSKTAYKQSKTCCPGCSCTCSPFNRSLLQCPGPTRLWIYLPGCRVHSSPLANKAHRLSGILLLCTGQESSDCL